MDSTSLFRELEKKIEEIGTAFDYCIIDGDVLRNVYYNPDSNSGGQIVVDEYEIKTQIIPYLEDINGNYKEFSWGEISSEAYESLYDFGNDEAMSLIYPWVMKDYEKSSSLEKTLIRIETEYYLKRVNNEKLSSMSINETVANCFGRDNRGYYEVYEDIKDRYLNGFSEDYKEGIRDCFEYVFGCSLKDITKDILKETEKEKQILNEDYER